MKRRILSGSFSGPNFAIRTAKMDCSRINFGELLFQFIAQNKHSLLLSRNLFWTAISVVYKSDVRNENKRLPFKGAFTGMRHYHRYFTEL